MRRILYVCEYGTLNGGERSLLAWLPYVAEANFEISVVAPPKGQLADALRRADIRLIPWDASCEHSQRRLQSRRTFLHDVMRELRPDLIHANSLSMSRVAGPVAKQVGVPAIGHLRDIIRVSRQVVTDINDNSRVLAVSRATADWHIEQGLVPQRMHVLYNGVDLNAFVPRSPSGYLHRELDLAPQSPLLAAIGQIGMRKGLDVLLTAMPSILKHHPEAHLLLIGQRTSHKEEAIAFENQLRFAAAQEPLSGRVHFLGYRDDVPLLMSELTLLVHAARQEPLGRVLLEAAAAGVGVVATDVGGTREIFNDSTGAIIPPDDAEAIANTAIRLLNERDLLVNRTVAARKSLEMRFDVRQSAAALLQHYRALL